MEELMTKICSNCKEIKPISEFYKRKDRSCHRTICKKCWLLHCRPYQKKLKNLPWYKVYKRIKTRCKYSESYVRRMIKKELTPSQIKYLWFRDKAYLMKKPSIDRINPQGNYALKNCRFMELSENIKRRFAQ